MDAHLTAAVVSNNIGFVQHVLANTVNGTTYAGIRARTTGERAHAGVHKHERRGLRGVRVPLANKRARAKGGPACPPPPSPMPTAAALPAGAPQNHWFGPAGDPRGAGIGTPEAIRLVWSCHREVITDHGPVPQDLKLVQS